MNCSSFKLMVSLLSILFTFSSLTAQTDWTKYIANPVLEPGPSGSWEDAWVSWPFVIYDSTQFIMYYTGFPDLSGVGAQGGRAISLDGINWTRDEGNLTQRAGFDHRAPHGRDSISGHTGTQANRRRGRAHRRRRSDRRRSAPVRDGRTGGADV